MAVEPTPGYDRYIHPLELWNSWFIDNEAELRRMANERNNDSNRLVFKHRKTNGEGYTGVIIPKEEIEGLVVMRFDQSCEYDNIFSKDTTWSPLLTSAELRALKSHIFKFYGDKKDTIDIEVTSPSSSNNSVLLSTDFLTTDPPAGENENEEVSITQPAATNQSPDQPPYTNQEQEPQGQEALDQAFLDELEESGFYEL